MTEKTPITSDCPGTWTGCLRHNDCKACKAYHHDISQKTDCNKKGSA